MTAFFRYTLLLCGWVALAASAVGLVLPLVPTVPFLLLATACFLKSSKRTHDWLLGHRVFGAQLRAYLAGQGISVRAKVVAIISLWASVLTSAFLFVPLLAVDALLVTAAGGVSVYLLRQPTAPQR